MSVLINKPIKDRMLANKLKRYDSDFNWIQDNRIDLIMKHNNKYIAVKNRDIAFFAPTMEELVILIIESDCKINDYIIDYLTDRKISLLF